MTRLPYSPEDKWLERASEMVQPIHAQGFFHVAQNHISYYIVFDYNDPLRYYYRILQDQQLYEQETQTLYQNMQQLIDQEKVVVNGQRVRPVVEMVDIGFRGRPTRPFIVFAVSFKAPLKPGVNTYENTYEPETISYNYEAYWILPPGSTILEVDMGPGNEEWSIVGGNILAIYGRRGQRTGGYEKIVFQLPETVYEQPEE